MEEVSDLAGQHEVIAENLQAQVINEIAILVKDFREERKKVSWVFITVYFCIFTWKIRFNYNS